MKFTPGVKTCKLVRLRLASGAMGIVTKCGDGGRTKLLSGETVSKADPRLNVVGSLDELIATLGLARSFAKKELAAKIKALQLELMRMSAEFSGCSKGRSDLATTGKHVSEIESRISKLGSKIKLPKSFLVPGTTQCASALELARTVARRAEREAIAIREAKGYENEHAFVYLNRLSDYLFLLARDAEIMEGVPFDAAKE